MADDTFCINSAVANHEKLTPKIVSKSLYQRLELLSDHNQELYLDEQDNYSKVCIKSCVIYFEMLYDKKFVNDILLGDIENERELIKNINILVLTAMYNHKNSMKYILTYLSSGNKENSICCYDVINTRMYDNYDILSIAVGYLAIPVIYSLVFEYNSFISKYTIEIVNSVDFAKAGDRDDSVMVLKPQLIKLLRSFFRIARKRYNYQLNRKRTNLRQLYYNELCLKLWSDILKMI